MDTVYSINNWISLSCSDKMSWDNKYDNCKWNVNLTTQVTWSKGMRMRIKKNNIKPTYSIFHGWTPPLHGGWPISKSVILTIFWDLISFWSAEIYSHLQLQPHYQTHQSYIASDNKVIFKPHARERWCSHICVLWQHITYIPCPCAQNYDESTRTLTRGYDTTLKLTRRIAVWSQRHMTRHGDTREYHRVHARRRRRNCKTQKFLNSQAALMAQE